MTFIKWRSKSREHDSCLEWPSSSDAQNQESTPDTNRALLILSVTWWRLFQTRVVLSWFWASLDEGYSRHESCSLDFERHLMKVIPDTSRALLILSVTWWRLFQTRVVLSWFWALLDEGYSRHESYSLDFERHLMKVIPDTSRALLILSVTWWRLFQTRVVLSWFWASLDEGYSRHESCSLDFERHLMKVIPDTSRALLILSVTWWRLFQTRVVLSWFWASLDEGYSRHESCSLDFERHLMKVIPDTSRALLILSVTWWRLFQTRVVLSWFWASLDEGYSRHESCSLEFERHLMKVIPDTSRALLILSVTWWRLFQTRVVHTTLIFIFLLNEYFISYNK